MGGHVRRRRSPHQRVAEDAEKVLPLGHRLVAAGSAYALSSLLEHAQRLEFVLRCEDPRTKVEDIVYKRLFVFVADERFDTAASILQLKKKQPALCGLCRTHPHWTEPCPDCIESPYDIIGSAYDYLEEQHHLARKWIYKQLQLGRLQLKWRTE
jgi:hypothetical protein